MTQESPDTVHGRLLEAVHIAGYTFERACGELEWLLDKDRWKTIGRGGKGYKHIDDFLDTLSLDEFRIAVEQRKKLARRLKDLGAGQRATARLVGVDEKSVRRDLGTTAANAATAATQAPTTAANAATPEWFQSDVDPSREAKRITGQETRRKERDANRRAAAATAKQSSGDRDAWVHHGSFMQVAEGLDAESVDIVFTDPPYHDDTLPIYRDLGVVAARVLKDGHSLITYTSHHRMPDVIRMIQAAGLTFFWPIAMVHTGGNMARMTEYGIIVQWKPLLWFVKGRFRSRDDMRFVHDLIESPPSDKDFHPWQQSTVEARYYIEALTQPGDLVFDPFCGGGTTAVAAAETNRQCVTCDTDEDSVWIARQRLREVSA